MKNREVLGNDDMWKLPEVDLDVTSELLTAYEELTPGIEGLVSEGKANEKMTVDRVR